MKISPLFPSLALALTLLVPPTLNAQQREEESESQQRSEQSQEQRERQQRERQQRDEQQRDEQQRDEQQRDEQQRDEQQDRERERYEQRERQTSQQRERRRERIQRDQPQAAWELEPRGWVRIAVDYDGDGRYDAFEQIYAFDLERARTSSRDRQSRMEQRERGAQPPQFEARSRGEQDRPTLRERFREAFAGQREQERDQPRLTRLEGELRNVRSMQLNGVEGKEKLAHLVTDEGRTERVALGPEQQLERLDLEEGSRVAVAGYRGEINDRPVIVAARVEADGDTVRINRQRSTEPLQRYHGEVLQTRTTQLRDHGERFVIADVRLDDGQKTQVILGPQSKVRQLDLQEGDEIALLARQARLNRQAALLAQHIAANEQVVRVNTPEPQQLQDQPQVRQRLRDARERMERERTDQPERSPRMPSERPEPQPTQERELPEA